MASLHASVAQLSAEASALRASLQAESEAGSAQQASYARLEADVAEFRQQLADVVAQHTQVCVGGALGCEGVV
eukprot:356976-Chlamydomonas_euryale.AAC.3